MTVDMLNVFLNTEFVGVLSKDNVGKPEFCYCENVNRALSLSLPIRKEKYSNSECVGFFNGLLPENYDVRMAVGKKYGVNPKNDFSLLRVIGYDCAGAVAFFEDNAQNNLKEYYDIEGEILEDEELEKFIKELPEKPLALGVNDMRLSLAGAQDKTAITLKDNKVAIPKGGTPTTHILKPAIKIYKETVENEYICLKSAQKLGISVPDIQIREVNGLKYFLIERYDRDIKNNKVKRIHQEDFCQASNIASAYKYQADGGVDFAGCFEILKKTSRPALEAMRFLELMLFNYLIGNNDAHGKNFSIIYREDGKIELAPAYDILCAGVYEGLSEKMAMKIGGEYKHWKITASHFEKQANELEISYTQLKKIIKNQCDILPDIVKEVAESFENIIGSEILKVVNNNCKRLKAGLS